MPCHAMPCHAMQCNAMQCMYACMYVCVAVQYVYIYICRRTYLRRLNCSSVITTNDIAPEMRTRFSSGRGEWRYLSSGCLWSTWCADRCARHRSWRSCSFCTCCLEVRGKCGGPCCGRRNTWIIQTRSKQQQESGAELAFRQDLTWVRAHRRELCMYI